MVHARLAGHRSRGTIGAAVISGSVALLGFGLESSLEAMASMIVIWRVTGARLASRTSEVRARQLVAVSFTCSRLYIAVEVIRALATGDRTETTVAGLVLTAGTAIFGPALGLAKLRIGVSDRPPPPGRERRTCCARIWSARASRPGSSRARRG
jgi:hypothetical protein